MIDDSNDKNHKPRGCRFTIGSLLLGITLVALFIAFLLVQRDVRQLQRIGTLDKPSSSEVAASVENYVSIHPKPVKVSDVKYSSDNDSFKVWYTFVDTTTGESLKSDVILKGEGFGSYVGCIKKDRFLAPLQNKDGLWLGISPPPTKLLTNNDQQSRVP